MSITNKLIESIKNQKLRESLDAMIQQRSNEDGEIRDVLQSTLPDIKKTNIYDELQALNIKGAAKIALKSFAHCLNVEINNPVVLSAKAYEEFYHLSFFDLSDLDRE
jgi:hypothetical protein